MSSWNPNIVVDPTATTPVDYRTAFKNTATVLRVNRPNSTTKQKIIDAVEAFSVEFPNYKYRFNSKDPVRNLKRLGQIIDDVYFKDILASSSLKSKLDDIVGLI